MKLKVSLKKALHDKQKADLQKQGVDQGEAGQEAIGKQDLLLPPLRNFKEGRYEDVITEFEKKRVRKAGMEMETSNSAPEKRQQRKKLRRAVKKMERKGVFAQKNSSSGSQ